MFPTETDQSESGPPRLAVTATEPEKRGRGCKLLSAFVMAALIRILSGCSGAIDDAPLGTTAAGNPVFQEITAAAGLPTDFVADADSDYAMPHIMGSGCAMFDANTDGLPDLLLIPSHPANTEAAARCTLLLQNPDATFRDQSSAAGLRVGVGKTDESEPSIRVFGMGAAVADVDNDGDADVLITTSGGMSLFLNNGHAEFADVTRASGLSSSRWNTAATFFDYDRDGWLDLFVVSYVDYFPGSICQDGTGRRDFCGPLAFTGTVDRLYRNTGATGGLPEFEDITVRCGLTQAAGKGLGAVCSDFDGDGRIDLYVANDMEPNRLWIQQPDGTFQDDADLRGCAVDLNGRPQASMGTAWCDLNRDGRSDLFLTHLRGETNTLYNQIGHGVFADQTAASGLGTGSLNFTGFGVMTQDLDLDGSNDVVIANGRVMRSALLSPEPATHFWDDYAERNQIFLNDGSGHFSELTPADDPLTTPVEVSRGLAAGDLDNDGDIDLLVNSTAAPARLYRNVAKRKGHWLLIRVVDPALRRDALGAQVTIHCGTKTWIREVQPNIGYLSSHDPRIHFGLGDADQFDSLEVVWPDHSADTEVFSGGNVDRMIVIERGSGVAKNPSSTLGTR